MASCISCGRDLPEGANFCEHCGQEVSAPGFTVHEVKDPAAGPLFEVRLGHYFRTGWATFLQYPVGFISFSLIVSLSMLVIIVLQQKLPLIGFLLTAAISPLHVGMYMVSAKLLQRQNCLFADFFAGFHYFQPLLIFGLIYGIIGGIGHLLQHLILLNVLFSLASLAFTVVFLFTPLLIVDRRLGLRAAMDLSLKTVQRCWLQIYAFVFLGGLLIVAGIVALGVGLLVTLPLFSCAITVAYADLFGLQSQEY